MENTLVIAGYVRNSDPSKKDTEVLNAQKQALRDYAQEHYGVGIPDTLMYEDAVSSLKHPYWEREGLMQSWDDAELNRFDKLLVTEFLRVARTSSEQCAVIEYFKRFDVELISITEKFEDTPEGKLLFNVQGYIGEVEAAKTKIRTSRGKRHRQSLVLTGQGRRTYGLTFMHTKNYHNAYYVPNTDVIAVIDGTPWTEIDVLALERKLCLAGMSTNSIALTLTKMGIPTQRGNTVWNRITVLQHLTNGNYRGYPYAVNNRWVREGRKSSMRRTNQDEMIPLPEGIYPRIVDPEEFDEIQEQLKRNKEMAARKNRYPNESLLRAGGVYCGICNCRMHVQHHTKPHGQHLSIQRSEYMCRKNQGVEELIRHHYVSIGVHLLDHAAWQYAIPYIEQPTIIRERIAALRGQVQKHTRIETLEAHVIDIGERIANLLSVAEGAKDELTRQLYRERLATLEQELREAQTLIAQFSNKEEREAKLLRALDKFEKKMQDTQHFLHDPEYHITQEDKRAALMVLGVKAYVFPVDGYEERVRFTIAPPEIQRLCEVDIVKAVQYAAEKMQASEQVPVSAGEGGE